MRAEQRVAAHGRLVDADGSVALVATGEGPSGGPFALPGGTVMHGEAPRETVRRTAAEALGVDVEPGRVLDVFADVLDVPERGVSLHTIRVVYDLSAPPGWPARLRAGARAVAAADLASPVLAPFTARALGLGPRDRRTGAAVRHVDARPVEAAEDGRPPKVQRVGAYALVPDAGRLLLTRYAGSGRWSLPGGGIDHGEQPLDAVHREVHEETGLTLADARLTDVDSVHFTGHAPDGTLEDFHAIRIVYRGTVPTDAQPAVLEVNGSSDAAAWIPLAELDRYPVTGFVGIALRLLA
ncbi:MAG TPA: NUDIX domain-containing protein [Kineosporiaceae bacterium]|nr:NUDIX domain-containing protein [Kineosporiaceae bacterium]